MKWLIIFILVVVFVLTAIVLYKYGIMSSLFNVGVQHGVQHDVQHGGYENIYGGDVGEIMLELRAEELDHMFTGGRANKGTKKLDHWTAYQSWSDLYEHPQSVKQYEYDRDTFMNNIDIDWSEVISMTIPKIEAKREYIGRINRDAKTNKMVIVEMIASPNVMSDNKKDNTIATIPADIVSSIINKPALLVFHTHPRGGFEYPSPQDVVSATYAMIVGHGAADLVVSRFGIHMISVSPELKADTLASHEPRAYINRVLYDFVTGFDGIRSWAHWTIDDMNDLYTRYRLRCITFPTAAYIHAAMRKWGVIRTTPSSTALLLRLQGDYGKRDRHAKSKPQIDDSSHGKHGKYDHGHKHDHIVASELSTKKDINIMPEELMWHPEPDKHIYTGGGRRGSDYHTESGHSGHSGRSGHMKFSKSVIDASKSLEIPINYGLFDIVDESRYSTLMPWVVSQVQTFTKRIFPDANHIMDLTAHIGTDLINFATIYPTAQIVGIEINGATFDVLRRNIISFDSAYPDRKYKERITVIHSAGEHIISEISPEDMSNIDILYMDPPWGGPDYVHSDSIELKLGARTVGEIALEAIDKGVRGILLKSPYNFDHDAFDAQIRDTGATVTRMNIMRSKPAADISFVLTAITR